MALAVFISLNSFAQVDSLKIKTSVSMQARDWLFLNSVLSNNEEFENVYDSVKVKLRATVQPSLTTVIKVDSIKQGQIISLSRVLKQDTYGVVIIPYTRINTALKSNAYLTAKINAIDDTYVSQYNERIQSEIDKLRSVNK